MTSRYTATNSPTANLLASISMAWVQRKVLHQLVGPWKKFYSKVGGTVLEKEMALGVRKVMINPIQAINLFSFFATMYYL